MVSVRRMCGIVGYAGPQAASPQAPSSRPLDVVLQGLARLEYRGDDSAGIAVVDEQVRVTKRSGKLKNLREALEATDTDARQTAEDRKSTRLNSSHVAISYAVFCLKKKKRDAQG